MEKKKKVSATVSTRSNAYQTTPSQVLIKLNAESSPHDFNEQGPDSSVVPFVRHKEVIDPGHRIFQAY